MSCVAALSFASICVCGGRHAHAIARLVLYDPSCDDYVCCVIVCDVMCGDVLACAGLCCDVVIGWLLMMLEVCGVLT